MTRRRTFPVALLFLVSLFALSLPVHRMDAQADGSDSFTLREPLTVKEPGHVYITEGALLVPAGRDAVDRLVRDYPGFDAWMLRGLRERSDENRGHPALLTAVAYDADADLFTVYYDLKIIMTYHGQVAFHPVLVADDSGRVTAFRAELAGSGAVLKDSVFVFRFDDAPGGTELDYRVWTRLSAFGDLFFTLRSYRRNMEWYIARLAENLAEALVP